MAKPQNQVLLRLDEEPELKAKFEVVKDKLGIRSNSEVLRWLINNRYKDLMAEQKATS